MFSSSSLPRIPAVFIPQCIYSSLQSLAPCEFLVCLTFLCVSVICIALLFLVVCPPVWYYSCPLIRSCLIPVSLPMSCKSYICIFLVSMSIGLFSFISVTPSPSIVFTLFTVCGWLCYCVNLRSDFLVSTLFPCPRQLLACLVLLYLCLSDYLDYDLCLSVYDLCLVPLNLLFHVTVRLGPFLHFPFTSRHRNI